MATPKLDEHTRKYLKEWGAAQMPTGQVVGGDMRPGYYRAFAVLGWIEKRKPWPVVGLQTIALRMNEDKHVGAVSLGLPVSPKTELYVNALLQTFGWDGRVWPYDNDGQWPEKTAEEEQVQGLLRKVNLLSTLTFPSTEQGIPSVRFYVAKSKGVFPIAPLEEINSPPVHLERFRALVEDPSPFHHDRDFDETVARFRPRILA